MKKKKLLLPILLLAPAFLASQVAADEQTAPETNLEVAAASTNATDAATPASQKLVLLLPKVLQRVQLSCLEANILTYQRRSWSDCRRKGVIGDAKISRRHR